jgi:gamma-glutamyltranspeptidase/glutathione hydrolase
MKHKTALQHAYRTTNHRSPFAFMSTLLGKTALAAVTLTLLSCSADSTHNNNDRQLRSVATGQAAIASAHPLATEAGMKVLRKGGNAFDAAIAVASTLGVVEPYSAGIGGGGFWLLYDADGRDNQGNRLSNQYQFLDAREKAPSAATRDMYLDNNRNVIPKLSTVGPLAAAIPGQAAAFAKLAEKYGNLPLADSLNDAIHYADNGFKAGRIYVEYLSNRGAKMDQYPFSKDIFYNKLADNDYQVPKQGDLIRQTDLANTLRALATQGFDGFYKGEIAHKMVRSVTQHGGIWTLDDLANYQVLERKPIEFELGDYSFISAPPPSSGGVALATILNILEAKNYDQLTSEGDKTHLLIEAMRLAYRDRAEYLGDSDFFEVDISRLSGKPYAASLAEKINLQTALPSASLGQPLALNQGNHTTHFSIIDQQGNRVSATLSINLSFGSGFVAQGTGVLLNNEMDDFSAKPGVPNAFGLVGSEANAIEPNKRPLSSMTPTMIESDQGVAVLGTPGGSRIITMVLLGALEHMKGKPVENWVNHPRFHHQYLPDRVEYENTDVFKAFTDLERADLERRGQILEEKTHTYGNMQAVYWDAKTKRLSAASDSRGEGKASVETLVPSP